MKLFAGLVATTFAIECPNDGWTANLDNTACEPSGVSITCNPTNMVVAFDADHLYVNLDETHVGESTADAFLSNDSDSACSPVLSDTDGAYTITIPLDDCGTTVTQSGGAITFSNQIIGNSDALKIDNIIVTESLALDVSCDYSDSFDLLVSDIAVEAAGETLDSIGDTGVMSTQFSLTSYTDALFSSTSAADNPIIIGEPVYNRIEVTGSIPSNVDFVVKDCVAMNAEVDATAEYTILKDGCLDNLVGTAEVSDDLRGDDSNTVEFSFNGFTFESTSDTLYLECSIVLCAIDSSGDFLDAGCGFDDTDLTTTCAASGYGLGTSLGMTEASIIN